MQKSLNYVKNIALEFVCLMFITAYPIIYFEYGYLGAVCLVLLNLFFLGFNELNKLNINYCYAVLNIFFGIVNNLFFRVMLSNFFIYSYEVLTNLETYTYDQAFTWAIFSNLIFYFGLVADRVINYKKLVHIRIYLDIVETAIFISLILFFILEILKFFFLNIIFAKCVLVNLFCLIILFMISVRSLMLLKMYK